MFSNPILQSALILGGVGLFFGFVIALVNRRFRVWEDPRIDGAWVASVDRAPGGRLLVTVVLPRGGVAALEAAFAALGEARPWLRAEVARAICRKRVPDLAFRVQVEEEAKRG